MHLSTTDNNLDNTGRVIKVVDNTLMRLLGTKIDAYITVQRDDVFIDEQ
jgi:hypothetical protein